MPVSGKASGSGNIRRNMRYSLKFLMGFLAILCGLSVFRAVKASREGNEE